MNLLSKFQEEEGFLNEVLQAALKDALERVTLPSDGPVVVVDQGRFSGSSKVAFNVALIVDQLKLRLPTHVEFQVFFNDLPSSDFNNVFQLLTYQMNDGKAKKFFAAGAPGSFYDRLFAESSVHVFHSSLCLHWLSTIPDAIFDKHSPAFSEGNVWTIHSRPAVAKARAKAYQQQAALDLKMYLNARAAELASGGLLFFTLPGRLKSEPNEPTDGSWDEFISDFTETWSGLAAEGFIPEELLYTFNLPCYMRSIEDVKEAIASCGSLFDVLTAKVHTFDAAPDHVDESVISEPKALSRKMWLVYKAAMDGPVEAHVGKELSELIWQRYLKLLEKRIHLPGKLIAPLCIVALIRK